MTPGTAPGVWLLDLDTGGEILHLSSETVAPTSRALGGAVVYRAALAPGDLELEAESVSLRSRGTELWRDASRLGPFRGRAATLRYWRGEPYLEDALVAVDGYVSDMTVSPPEGRDAADLSIVRADARSSDVCDPQHTVTTVSFTTSPLTTGPYPQTMGAVYPWVIGAPGRLSPSETGYPQPVSPGVCISRAGGGAIAQMILIARGHVPADAVAVWDMDEFGSSGSIDECPTEHTTDDLGNEVTVIRPADAVLGQLSLDPGMTRGIGWKVQSGWGRGLTHKGREVTGLGDVLSWGADLFAGSERYDRGEIEARRERLNRYQIDCVINQLAVPWDEWVEANLAEVFQLETVTGPRGLYWREAAWSVDPLRAAATLVCDRSAPGVAVTRESGLVERSDGEIVRELSVSYAPRFAGGFHRRLTYGAVRQEYVVGQPDSAHSGHPLLARAAGFRGAVTTTIAAWPVWDQATADLVAQLHVQRLALPHRLVEVSGAQELIDLRPYSTVRIIDGRIGLDEYALVLPPPRISPSRRVRLTLRIPPSA